MFSVRSSMLRPVAIGGIIAVISLVGTWSGAQQPAPAQPAPRDEARAEVERALAAARDAAAAAHADVKDAAEKMRAELQMAGVADNADGQQRAFVWSNRKGKKEKAAFLGVTTNAADAAMRDQLKLPRGIGLVVQNVEENSPAASAGIQEHDILTKLDDQWLVNAPQFGVVVRMHKPGDEVSVTVVRQGQPQTLKAKLAEKEVYIADSDGTATALAPWAVAGNGGMTFMAPQAGDLQALEKLNNFPGWRAMADEDDADLIIKDNDRTMKIKVRNGEKNLVVSDNQDKVLFEGPIETDEQRKALPADIAAELDKYQDQIDKLKDAGPGNKKKIRIIKGDGR